MKSVPQTKKRSKSKRAAVTIAAVATLAFAAAGPAVATAHSFPNPPGGCDEWGCGTNHNEVLATTPAA
jgi:hypothetical protein